MDENMENVRMLQDIVQTKMRKLAEAREKRTSHAEQQAPNTREQKEKYFKLADALDDACMKAAKEVQEASAQLLTSDGELGRASRETNSKVFKNDPTRCYQAFQANTDENQERCRHFPPSIRSEQQNAHPAVPRTRAIPVVRCDAHVP
jgi:hypothetical protein